MIYEPTDTMCALAQHLGTNLPGCTVEQYRALADLSAWIDARNEPPAVQSEALGELCEAVRSMEDRLQAWRARAEGQDSVIEEIDHVLFPLGDVHLQDATHAAKELHRYLTRT